MSAPSDNYQPSPTQRVSEQVQLYESTDGAEGGTLEGRPVVILTHVGAKTGVIRKTPIMRIPDGDSYLAVASAAGAARNPAWYGNLLAHPRVHLQDHATQLDLVARELTGADKQRPWRVSESFWPHFPEYRASAGTREIPILLLEPETRPNSG